MSKTTNKRMRSTIFALSWVPFGMALAYYYKGSTHDMIFYTLIGIWLLLPLPLLLFDITEGKDW